MLVLCMDWEDQGPFLALESFNMVTAFGKQGVRSISSMCAKEQSPRFTRYSYGQQVFVLAQNGYSYILHLYKSTES